MKKTLLSFVLILCFGFIISYKSTNEPTIKGVQTRSVVNKISVEQKITPNKTTNSQFITYKINSGKTALDLLKQSTTLITKGEGTGAYVTSINNIVAEDSKKQFWSFYINDKQAMVGAGSYKLINGDKIEWKLETY